MALLVNDVEAVAHNFYMSLSANRVGNDHSISFFSFIPILEDHPSPLGLRKLVSNLVQGYSTYVD